MHIILFSKYLGNSKYWTFDKFRKELEKHCEITYFGPGYSDGIGDYSVKRLMDLAQNELGKPKPDAILLDTRAATDMLEDLPDTDVFKIHITHDFTNWNPGYYMQYLRKYKFDLVLCRMLADQEVCESQNLAGATEFFPFSVCTDTFYPTDEEMVHDVMCSYVVRPKMEGFYPLRLTIRNYLRELEDIALYYNIVNDPVEYSERMRHSKIVINSVDRHKCTSSRFSETMASGRLLLTDASADMEAMGFRALDHFGLFEGLEDFKEKLRYWLSYDEEREEVARQGMKFVREHHSNRKRAQQFVQFVEKHI